MSAGNRNPKTMAQNERKSRRDESPPQSHSTDAHVSKGNDQLKAPLNNSRNNKSSVIHQKLKGKVHKKLKGQVVHHYGSLGYGCQNNNIDISNPIIGLKLGKLDTSSGSGSNLNKINDLMYLVPNSKPKMQTQNYGHCSDYKYSQTGSQSYHECRRIKNNTCTIPSNRIHNQRDADVIMGNDQLEASLNNSRNNKWPKGKVHQKLKGKEIHPYNLQGYGRQYNNIDTCIDLGELAHQVPGASNGHPIVIKEDNFSFIGAYSNECEFNICTEDHPHGLFYQSNLETASNYPRPGIHLSETVTGMQFHDYALVGSFSKGSSFNLDNHTPRVNRHAQDPPVRSPSTPSRPRINYSLTVDGMQFHNYGVVGSSSTSTWFNFNNEIRVSDETGSGMS